MRSHPPFILHNLYSKMLYKINDVHSNLEKIMSIFVISMVHAGGLELSGSLLAQWWHAGHYNIKLIPYQYRNSYHSCLIIKSPQ